VFQKLLKLIQVCRSYSRLHFLRHSVSLVSVVKKEWALGIIKLKKHRIAVFCIFIKALLNPSATRPIAATG